jgi:glutaredoxin
MIIRIYSKPDCEYCEKAKGLFKLIDWEPVFVNEFVLGVTLAREDVVQAITENCPVGTKITVPQIWVDGRYIGGYTEFKKYYDKMSAHVGDWKKVL